MVGKTISHYRILSEIGKGGMGVVYKAEDTRLGRTVAIKFLSSNLLTNDEARRRFLREAKAAATLDHPNICTFYEIDEVDGRIFLVMACVDGESLAHKIAKRPLALNDALDIAVQVARGLEAAHKKGIVHRDIKSENIMIDTEGLVKVMDFGLAQLTGGTTITLTGSLLGTPSYMSPEQVRGEGTDPSTDIWSLGVVIYEMVTGRRPFLGESAQSVALAILNEEPEPVSAQRSLVPIELDWIIAKALEKNRADRYQNVKDFAVDLRNLSRKFQTGASTVTTPAGGAWQRPASPKSLLSGPPLKLAAATLAVLLAAAIVTIVILSLRPAHSAFEAPLRTFSIAPAGFDIPEARAVISPNGRHIAYIAGTPQKLWVQDLDRPLPRAIDGADGAMRPFWSPDSDYIGFVAGEELRTVPAAGGPVVRVCRLPVSPIYFSGAWTPDADSIVFSAGLRSRLYQVPAQGGDPALLPESGESDSNLSVNHPTFLPAGSGRRLAALSLGGTSASALEIRNLDTGERHALAAIGEYCAYSPTSHLICSREGVLWAVPFSLRSLAETGDAFPIAQRAGWPSVAADGTLVYVEQNSVTRNRLVWRAPNGDLIEQIDQPWSNLVNLTLSRDARRVAFQADESGDADVWVFDFSTAARIRVTDTPGIDRHPAWSPAGDQIAFSSNRNGTRDIFVTSANGSASATLLLEGPGEEILTDWSVTGDDLLYYETAADTDRDIFRLHRTAAGTYESQLLLQTPSDEHSAVFSPDGDWMAYVTNRSGGREVFLRRVAETSEEIPVSRGGGSQPRWRRDGRELYYVEGDTLMAVPVTPGPVLSIGPARRLFSDPGLRSPSGVGRTYDVTANGQRFLIATPVDDAATVSPAIRVVQNWFAAFRDRR